MAWTSCRAAPRAQADRLRRRHRHRQGRSHLRQGAARQGAALCRRGCRRDPAPAPAAEAAPGAGAPAHASTRPSSGRWCRSSPRWSWPASRSIAKALQALSDDFAGRMARAGARDPQARRHRVQHRLAQAAGRGAVRRAEAARRQEGQDRRLRAPAPTCWRSWPLTSGHPLPQKVLDWRQLAKLKSTYTDALQNEINPKTGRVHTSYALALTLDRAAVLERSQPAEHPDPHRGRAQDPPRLRRGEGAQAALGRLFADRAAPRRRHGRHPGAEARPSARASTSTP